MKFSRTLETTADPASVWAVWTDVAHWPEWDSELKDATLAGDFRLGAMGWLTPKQGPRLKFSIVQVNWGESYTYITYLPLCRLKVYRYMRQGVHQGEAPLSFTHEVSFEGFLGFFFGWLLGRQFKSVLPSVMQSVRDRAV
ncbi:MAG: SRPBCC family protein [Cyanobacteria bacterium J06623_4]